MALRRYGRVKVLIVEDETDVITRLDERLLRSTPGIETVIARSRSSGIAVLRNDEFDFIICDLRLPPNDGGLDTDEAHGLAVYAESRSVCPGTPCLFFTGFDTSPEVKEQLSSGGTHDIFGTSESYAMTRILTKDRFLSCIERLEAFNTELAVLDAIDIELSSGNRNLDQFEERALQMQARSLGAESIEASALGGLSGAQTMRAWFKDEQERTLGSYFVKIDKRANIEKERKNYHQHVSPLLKMGHYPALTRDIVAGIGKREALFYQLADDYVESLFDVLENCESAAISAVKEVRSILAPWADVSAKKTVHVRDLRTLRIDETDFQPYRDALGFTERFEVIKLEMTTSRQHGDLHGFNILCNDSGTPVVIDFGNVGPAPTCIDPVILELSVLFHCQTPGAMYQ